jgi:hypothetical protein
MAKKNTLVQLEEKVGKALVVVKHPDGTETNENQIVGAPQVFDGPTCNVGVGAKVKMNLGNYSSAEMSVSRWFWRQRPGFRAAGWRCPQRCGRTGRG